MSGRTGKLTAAALEERGPRMGLYSVGNRGFFIAREDMLPLASNRIPSTWAKSFSLAYLLRIAKGNQ